MKVGFRVTDIGEIMDFKLIALDIDGTLLNSNKELTPHTRYALIEAQRQGKRIIIACWCGSACKRPYARKIRRIYYGIRRRKNY